MDEITYRILRSNRRTTAIQIEKDGTVLVRCPQFVTDRYIRELIKEKEGWIRKKLAQRPVQTELMSREQLRALTERAVEEIPKRVAHYAALMGVTYGRITIRNQKTRWGSCSSKGNLNFNCLLMLAPEQVMDYVVVHELSHRIYMNHSAAFWKTVEAYMPDYAQWRKWLRDNGASLMAQLT